MTTQIKVRDKGNGFVWLSIKDGVVIGALGSSPKRFVGLTETQARRMARYGKA